jgi:phosphoglycolate phosphatase
MQIKGVIFDLDGTLIDSLTEVANLANAVLSAFGFEQRSKEEYRYFAGQGAYSLMASSSGSKDDALIMEMVKEFERMYVGSQNVSKAFDGITEALVEIYSKGVKMAVLSNKPEHLTRLCVNRNFNSSMFEAVFGQKEGREVKPHPQGALEIADVFGLAPNEIVIIGDTKNDILAAKNGDFYSVGVTWGFRDRAELIECGADVVVDTPQQLLNII